jgi:hypothetical protein
MTFGCLREQPGLFVVGIAGLLPECNRRVGITDASD